MEEKTKTKITIKDIETGRRHNAKSLALRLDGRNLRFRNDRVAGERNSTGAVFKYKRIIKALPKEQQTKFLNHDLEVLNFDTTYRAIKAKELVDALEDKVRGFRKNNISLKISKAGKTRDFLKEIAPESVDAIITKLPQSIDAIYDLIISTQHVLKKKWSCCGFYSSNTLKRLYQSVSRYSFLL